MFDIEKAPSNKPAGTNVTKLYPEIRAYWISKGMPKQHIEIFSSPNIDEDCLYLYGKWYGYCRKPMEWKIWKDLDENEKPPKAKMRPKLSTL